MKKEAKASANPVPKNNSECINKAVAPDNVQMRWNAKQGRQLNGFRLKSGCIRDRLKAGFSVMNAARSIDKQLIVRFTIIIVFI